MWDGNNSLGVAASPLFFARCQPAIASFLPYVAPLSESLSSSRDNVKVGDQGDDKGNEGKKGADNGVEHDWRYVYGLLGSLTEHWNRANFKQKRRFLAVMFPQGLILANGVIGTPAKLPIFNILERINEGKSRMAAPRGLEPL